ncbi:MAG TPA: TetR/AcrR family transcriptional regulator [Candidatus Binataceae bacterium]|jgi:AcrR family transcriptional regulator|nr:TetR/AcrR family transcriptional regulator [Candidatus Binataceae bacterium]
MSRYKARAASENRDMTAEPESRGTGKRLTQDERRERSESRMLAAAIDLFARQGSGRTTLVEIGKVAGYTHGLVGHRFGSKSGLVRRLIKNLQRDFTRRQLTGITERRTGLEALLEVVRSSLNLMAEGTTSARVIRALTVLAGEALGPVPEILGDVIGLNRNFKTVLRRLIEQGIEAGEIRKDVRPAEQATLILAILRGVEIQWCQDPNSLSLDSIINETITSLRRSLQSPSAR